MTLIQGMSSYYVLGGVVVYVPEAGNLFLFGSIGGTTFFCPPSAKEAYYICYKKETITPIAQCSFGPFQNRFHS